MSGEEHGIMWWTFEGGERSGSGHNLNLKISQSLLALTFKTLFMGPLNFLESLVNNLNYDRNVDI